jgi:hypothetical protein
MAAVSLGRTQSASVNYTYTVASSSDNSSIPNSTYFYNLTDNKTYYKDSLGLVHPNNEYTWSEWSSKVAITIGAVTTGPTKATTKQNDYVQYRTQGGNEVEARYLYSATSGSGAADGAGNYLWTLPDSFQFDTTVYTVYTGASVDLSGIYSLFGVVAGTFNSLDTYSSQVLVVPYNSTQFRVLTCGTNYPKDYIGSGRFPMGNNNIVQALNFKFFKA